MSSSTKNDLERVVCLIDMDCFYVQVEEVAAPEFRGKPCGVSQYNPYKGGGLIAVNYEARKFGVKRGMRGEEAKALCPEFHIFFVQEKRGKADLSKYRDASAKIFEILGKNFKNVEKASIDEAYIDLTDLSLEAEKQTDLNIELTDSFVVGKYAIPTEDNKIDQEANLKAWLDTVQHQETKVLTNERLLAVGALLVQRVRKEIFDTLGFHCSAGLAHNKTLAKFCAGLNKPNRQTILPLGAVQDLYQKTPINKIKNLGGKLGIMLTDGLNLNTMSDLAKKSLSELTGIFGEKTGNWLHQISKGIDTEPVMSRRAAKSIGCSKNFRGNQVLNTHTKLEYWARNLCEELEERLESDKAMNQRDATLLVVQIANEAGSFSKSAALATGGYCSKKLTGQIMEMLQGFNKSKIKDQWHPVIYGLGISATKFVSKEKPANSIQKYFNAQAAKKSSKTESDHESKSRTSSSEGPIDLVMESDSNWNCDEETEQIMDEKSADDDEETENKQDKETNEKTTTTATTTTNQATKNKKPDIKNLLMKQAEKAATAAVNKASNSRTSSSEGPIDLVVESDSNSNCNEENEDENEKTTTTNQATKNKKPDIKNLLMKQAEKAATAVVNKTNVSPPTKPATKEKKPPDIKSMLLKQAEKAVVAPIILNINTVGSNKENVKKAENKTSKVDVKSLLLKQGEKAVKVKPKPVMRPHIERENTPKRNSSPPILITIGDSPEDDDYAQVRASLTKFAEKSAKKLGKDNKSTPSVKRLSIELTPLKAKPPKSAKKSKANDN